MQYVLGGLTAVLLGAVARIIYLIRKHNKNNAAEATGD